MIRFISSLFYMSVVEVMKNLFIFVHCFVFDVCVCVYVCVCVCVSVNLFQKHAIR